MPNMALLSFCRPTWTTLEVHRGTDVSGHVQVESARAFVVAWASRPRQDYPSAPCPGHLRFPRAGCPRHESHSGNELSAAASGAVVLSPLGRHPNDPRPISAAVAASVSVEGSGPTRSRHSPARPGWHSHSDPIV